MLLLQQVALLFLKAHEEVEKQNKAAARSCAVCHLVSGCENMKLDQDKNQSPRDIKFLL